MTMKALGAGDAMFLYAETPEQHQHMIAIIVLDPSTAPRSFTVQDLIDKSEHMVEEAPAYRQRLFHSPLSLSGPILEEDPDFNYRNHVRHVALPSPGSDEQLAEMVADIASSQLDRSRPLWETWFVSGLAGGKVAMISKTHHCLADGVGGAETMMKLFDFEPNPPKKSETTQAVIRKAQAPSRMALFQEGLKARRKRTSSMTVLNKMIKSVRGKRSALSESDNADALPSGMTSMPRLRFNGQISRFRSVGFGSLSLKDVKAIKNAFGVTLNDAVLAVCTIALQRYLAGHNDLPDSPIVCTVPVSLTLNKDKTSAVDSEGANQFGMMNVKLPLDINAPIDVIKAVHTNASEAKRVFKQSFEDVLNTTLSALPPQIAAMGLQLISGGITARFPISNVAISNVPGAPIPLYIEGAKVVANYPMGPVPNGVGLNITMMSYVDRLDFCVQGCRNKIPDPWVLVEHINAAMAELLELIPAEEDKPATRARTRGVAGKKKAGSMTPAKKTAVRKKAPARKKPR